MDDAERIKRLEQVIARIAMVVAANEQRHREDAIAMMLREVARQLDASCLNKSYRLRSPVEINQYNQSNKE